MPLQEATVTFHREADALVLCARIQLADDQREELHSLVKTDFDWDHFYRLARRHSLVSLVHLQLETSVKNVVPTATLQRFRKDYQENAARNVVLAGELTSLTDALAQDGIEAIAFKGPALAISAYGDLNLRRFVDLDLIVRRADMPRAIAILQQRGYTAAKSLDEKQQALLLRTQHNLQFTRGRVIVELHWQVASELFASSVTAESLWQHLETVEVNGTKVKTLSKEDLLFALCVHGSRHLWQRLAWICDIDRIVNTRPQIDWHTLLGRAQRAKAERMFLLGLALAKEVLGTELPSRVGDAIATDERIPALVAETRARLFDGPEQRPFGLTETVRFNLLVRSDWRSRIRYCRFLFAPTDRDLEIVYLSPRLHFAYYFLRPLRLLRGTPAQEAKTGRELTN